MDLIKFLLKNNYASHIFQMNTSEKMTEELIQS